MSEYGPKLLRSEKFSTGLQQIASTLETGISLECMSGETTKMGQYAELLVPGVFIEVLWDIELTKKEGRREGERTMSSVWWRAQLVSTQVANGKVKATIRYDARDGFQEQLGEVWILPKHVQIVDDELTQLRWRFYECSGNVTYDLDEDQRMRNDQVFDDCKSDFDSSRVKALEESVAILRSRFDGMERMIAGQMQFLSRVIGAGSTSDRQCTRFLHTMRQKVALAMQKPIPTFKPRSSDGEEQFFEGNCTGSIRTEVDCSLEDFESLARAVHSSCSRAHFRPPFEDTQSPQASLEAAEILFPSLKDLCAVIGVTAVTDIRNMLQKGKGNQKEDTGHEVAVRLLGVFIADGTDDDSAAALLVGRCIDVARCNDTVEALMRKSRRFDLRTMSYCDAIFRDSLQAVDLVRRVFVSKLSACSGGVSEHRAISEIFSEFRHFSLRWHPIPNPSIRIWTRSTAFCPEICGSLQIEFPYVIIRGMEAVLELNQFLTDEYVKELCAHDVATGRKQYLS